VEDSAITANNRKMERKNLRLRVKETISTSEVYSRQ